MKTTHTETWRDSRPAFLFDVAANESWLEDWAAKGYRLVDFKRGSGIFVTDAPMSCRYRLEPLARKEQAPDPERTAVYAEMGWTYAVTMAGAFHVWRSDDPAAPELDTDPVVQGEGYGYLKRRMLRELLFLPLVLLALAALLVWSRSLQEFPLWSVVYHRAPGILTLWAAALLIAIAAEAWEYRLMRRLLHRLKTGIPLDRPAPYRWQRRLGRLLTALVVCVYCSSLVGDLLGGFWPMRDPEQAVYADLAVLEPESSVVYISAETKVHELAPRMYTVSQSTDGLAIQLATEYYHLCSAALMPAMERDVLGWRMRYSSVPMERLQDCNLDSFWWRDTGTAQEVVASLGRNVLYLRYDGPTDLRTVGAYLAEVLAEQ